MTVRRRQPDSEAVESPWFRPEAAAEYLGVALGTLRNWTSARYVPFARRGRVVRYHRDALDRWRAGGSCPGRGTIADLPDSAP
jgi:excisionase family DNA binding protein